MVLSATEKLKILATGKATLKEINELEKQAEGETTNENDTQTNESTIERKEEVDKDTETVTDESNESKEDDASVSSSVEDEKNKKIAELESKIKQMQKDNVNADNSGDVIDTETALLNIFKDFK